MRLSIADEAVMLLLDLERRNLLVIEREPQRTDSAIQIVPFEDHSCCKP